MILNLNWRNKIRRLRDWRTNKALVLMYHRVADLTNDPWQLAVTAVNFEQQLVVLKKNYKVISINELVSHLEKKSVPSNTVCITFDDGYSDNYSAAKPLLEKYECPATFFVSSQYVEQHQSFWWDELEEVILNSEKLPTKLSIKIAEQLLIFQLENDDILTDEKKEIQKSWIWSNIPPNRRCELYLTLWERLRLLPHREILIVIEKIKFWAGYNEVVKENLPMTNQQLKDLANHQLFDIGLHTVTHPTLSFHSKEIQFKEIAINEKFLKHKCKKLTRALSYPFGNYNEITLSVVKEQSLIAAFTNREQAITNRSDIYHLGRFQIKNWNAEEFKKQFLKWKEIT